MPEAPALPFVVSSSTWWLMSKDNERKATVDPEPVNAYDKKKESVTCRGMKGL